MKLWSKMKPYKRIWAVLVIILLTVCIEAGFNYPALVNGYGEIDLSTNIQVKQKNNTENYIISWEFDQPVYIKQLKLRGSFTTSASYKIETVEVNSFDKQVESSCKDYVNSWFTEFYTNLNAQITSMKITVPKAEGDQLWSVSVSNQAEFNKYRMIFIAAILLIIYCIFFEKIFREKQEYFFLLFSLAFGILMLVFAQPQCNAWDEQVHFQNAYRLASGRAVEWNEASEAIANALTVNCNTKAEFAQLRAVMNEKGTRLTTIEEREGMIVSYYSLSYLPMAIFLKLGMWADFSFTNLFIFGKLGNLLAYILVMFLAIRMAKAKKLFLLFITLMPTSLFLACSYTYDSTSFSWITLGAVLWANEMTEQKENCRKWPAVISLIFILAGGLSKIVYLPLALLIILLPQIKQISKKKKRMMGIIIVAMGIMVLTILLKKWFLPVLNGDILYADTRGGETSLAGQLVSVLAHPWSTIKLFIREILSLDNFRNSGNAAYNNFFVGNLMFLNYYRMGVMPDKWCLLLLPVLMVLLLFKDKKEDISKRLDRKQSIFVIVLLLIVIILIWASMYLAFTPIGEAEIEGVQVRYYLPLLYFAGVLISNKKVYIQAEYKGVAKLIMISVLVFETVSMYDFILKSRLF